MLADGAQPSGATTGEHEDAAPAAAEPAAPTPERPASVGTDAAKTTAAHVSPETPDAERPVRVSGPEEPAPTTTDAVLEREGEGEA